MDNENLTAGDTSPQGEPISNASEKAPEKRFTQDEVNSIVGNRAREAAEKARREAESQYESKLKEMKQSSQQQQANQQPPQGGQSLDGSANIESKFESFLQKKEQEREQKAFDDNINRIANEFTGKVNDPKVKSKYEDYDNVLGSKKMDRYPNTILMANDLSNTADVYYHLLKHPEKLATIENTARFTDPDAAKDMMKKISSDLQKNSESKATYRKADEPLSRIKPGTVGGDSGKPSLADFKRLFKG